MVNSHDVARAAGVSQATVSRVFNGLPHIRPEVRQRVHEAAKQLGYVRNVNAKALSQSRAGAIGLVTSDIQNPYYPYLLDELTRAANERGIRAIVWDDTTADGRYAVEGLTSGAVDGLILTSLRTTSTDVDALLARGSNFVVCNRAPEAIAADVVMADHEIMTRTVAEYIATAGRRRIAAIFGARDSVATPFRKRGLTSALDTHGIDLDPSLIRDGETTYDSGYASMVDLLQHAHGDFDTVFCTSDILAFGAIDALREAGLSIPEDVWVTGVDGLPMSRWRGFDLTTVEQDVPRIAVRAVERLIARIEGDTSEPRRDIVPARLVVRGSTAGHACR